MSVKWVATDGLTPAPNAAVRADREPKPEEVCLIQYTSGSTGEPKGVMISHRCLLLNCRAIFECQIQVLRAEKATRTHGSGPPPSFAAARPTCSHTRVARLLQQVAVMRACGQTIEPKDGVFIWWVPQYHDMGLIGAMFTTVYAGLRGVACSPLDFIQRPLLWDELVQTYKRECKAIITGGPTFAFGLMMKRLKQKQVCSSFTSGSAPPSPPPPSPRSRQIPPALAPTPSTPSPSPPPLRLPPGNHTHTPGAFRASRRRRWSAIGAT